MSAQAVSTPLDVVADPLFTVARGTRTEAVSLPALLAALLADGEEITAFPELTAEQRGYVWRFWVRCAAKVLHERGLTVEQIRQRNPGELAADIERTLSDLAPNSAWLLHQPDPARPGFLQIPTPDGQAPGTGNNYSERSASLLTSTIGGKNHERKSDLGRELTPEQTAYALIEYQLSAIFGGRGNYESQLMGSRAGAGSGVPFMGARIADSTRATFRHDVGVILDSWRTIVQDRGLRGNVWALWTEPWDGKGQLGSERLDPAFIPIARMIRLAAPEAGQFRTVWFRPTDTGRVRDHTDGGHLGDPFTPLVLDPKTGAPKVRGTLGGGYSYGEVVRLLFGDDERGGTPSPSVAALANLDDQQRTDLRVLFEGTAYEQGKTGGFHHRSVLLPAIATGWIDNYAAIREVHAEMLDAIKKTKAALRGAARIVLNGELKPRTGDEGKTAFPVLILDQRVDAAYLEQLFAAAERRETGEDNWMQPWLDWLAEQAKEVFRASLGMLPVSTGRRWEREVQANSYLAFKMWDLRGRPQRDAPDEGMLDPVDTASDEPEPVSEEIG